MSARQIIEAIKQLPSAEQAEVLRFAHEFAEHRRMSPDELESLGQHLAESSNQAESERLTDELVRGFYGGEAHAWHSPQLFTRGSPTASRAPRSAAGDQRIAVTPPFPLVGFQS